MTSIGHVTRAFRAQQAQISLFHAGIGLLPGRPFPLPPDRRVTVRVRAGSLLPPFSHPASTSWTRTDQSRRPRGKCGSGSRRPRRPARGPAPWVSLRRPRTCASGGPAGGAMGWRRNRFPAGCCRLARRLPRRLELRLPGRPPFRPACRSSSRCCSRSMAPAEHGTPAGQTEAPARSDLLSCALRRPRPPALCLRSFWVSGFPQRRRSPSILSSRTAWWLGWARSRPTRQGRWPGASWS